MLKPVQNLTQCVQICSNVFKYVLTCSNLFITCANVIKWVQICSKLFQMSSNVLRSINQPFIIHARMLTNITYPVCTIIKRMLPVLTCVEIPVNLLYQMHCLIVILSWKGGNPPIYAVCIPPPPYKHFVEEIEYKVKESKINMVPCRCLVTKLLRESLSGLAPVTSIPSISWKGGSFHTFHIRFRICAGIIYIIVIIYNC